MLVGQNDQGIRREGDGKKFIGRARLSAERRGKDRSVCRRNYRGQDAPRVEGMGGGIAAGVGRKTGSQKGGGQHDPCREKRKSTSGLCACCCPGGSRGFACDFDQCGLAWVNRSGGVSKSGSRSRVRYRNRRGQHGEHLHRAFENRVSPCGRHLFPIWNHEGESADHHVRSFAGANCGSLYPRRFSGRGGRGLP